MKTDRFIDTVMIVVFMTFVLVCLTSLNAHAQEKYMATDVGFVVITDEPCHIEWEQPGNGLSWHAYATDVQQAEPHIGCWGMPDQMTVQIYWPEIEASGVYNARLFKDEKESF